MVLLVAIGAAYFGYQRYLSHRPFEWAGTIEARAVTVGSRSLLSRQHPTLRTPVGGAIFVRVNPEKCVVFSAA